MTTRGGIAYLAGAEMPEEDPTGRPVPSVNEQTDRDLSHEAVPKGAMAAEPVSHARAGAAWGAPLMRFDLGWTKLETYLAAGVLAAEIFALTLWVFLKGMSTPPDSESAAGVVFRALFGSVVLGLIPYVALKSKGQTVRNIGATLGALAGILLAKAWVNVGVDYTSNLLNWYQQASVLTLFGGLRGIGTRLTLLLALLGGSLATGRGKHITIDLLTRFVNERLRLPIVVFGWLGSAMICLAASWGFFDHIAIENFGAKADASAGQKVSAVTHELGEQVFMLRKQISLDMKSAPHIVFKSEPYANWLKGKEWNQWLDDHGFVERYGADAVKNLRIPDDELRSPMIVIPGVGEPRGRLVDAANLVFPFGLLMIALRFILRSLLAISGQVSVDPDEGDEFSSETHGGATEGSA